jgi:nucleoside-diphosphate-sugar epimerase
MNVLVTGGAGYIGSVLCEHLLAAGHEVIALDSLVWNNPSLFHLCHYGSFDFVHGDVRDTVLMEGLVSRADVIIPLAAIVGAPACQTNSWEAWQVNCDSIAMLNDIRSNDQFVIYPTTNSGYGTQSGEVFCTEETPLEPISIYGQTKVNAEKILLDSPNVVSFRLATVFGMSPRMRLDLLVNDFVYQAVTNKFLNIFEKTYKRNYVHIRDVADCFTWAISNAESISGNVFNLGLDEANLSKEELALKIKEFVPDLDIRFSEHGSDIDKRNYIVSNEKLRLAGFEARRSIETGISELLKGYRVINGCRKKFHNA